MSAVMHGWEKRRITLPFRIGDISLAEVGIDAAVMTRPYTEISPDAAETYPLEVLKELGTKVAVIHSCPVEGVLSRVSLTSGAVRYVPASFPRYHTNLTVPFGDYLSSQFSSKSRATLLRKVKKVAKKAGGSLDVREFKAAGEMDEWHRLARKVSQKTYQERLLKRGLPESPKFVREICEQAEQGRFRGYLLYDEGAPIAYLACPITSGGAMIYDHVGHDPGHNNLSPGTVLLYAVLERAFEDPSLTMFDFTEGDGNHKQRFATNETSCADVWFFAPNARNVLTVGLHTSFDKARSLSIAALERGGAKERMKKFLRNMK